ncbi:hypothetical protein FJY90_08210 [Candidatus Gottesmanbacteria bacterium]|nr:hypothetical protein [Candidatus Gottesmanbacteria bacterium]
MSDETKIIVKDSEDLQNILIQVDLKEGKTTVISGFSPWENLALIIEGLGVTAQMCIKEGIPKGKVYQAIKDYIMKIIDDYKIIKEAKKVTS